MIRRTWTVALLWGVALGCSSGSGSSGTGGHGGGGAGTGGHAGGSAQGGHGGTAGGAGGSAGATGGTAGAVGGTAGGSAGAAGGHAGGAGGHAGAAGGGAGAAGGQGAGTGGTTCSGSAGAAGSSAGGAAGGAAGSAGTSGGGAGGANPVLARGEYLVRSVLNCGGCHTPTGGVFLSGKDCFAGSTTGPDCLSSANLTNDDNGLKGLTDQQIKDAFRAGKDPDQAGAYLFSNMPYYQFANVSDDDATAIVAYLRTVPADAHKVQANAGIYATQPTAAQWAPVNPADLPAAGSAAGAANGKYLATLTCVTCHTVDATGATPQHIDATKAFQGGKLVAATTTTNVQTSNLTPDATGIMGWSAADIAMAIKQDKNKTCKTICGMRGLANMTDSDANDIAAYLMSIPPVANTITMLCN